MSDQKTGAGLIDPGLIAPAIMLLGLGALWGLSFSLSKVAAMGGVHPFAYAWMQSTGAALFLTLVCYRRGIPFDLSRGHLLFFLGAAVIGLVLPNINIITTAKYIPAGVMSTVVSTVPVLGYVLAVAFRIEGFRWNSAVGICIGLIGALLMVLPKTSLPSPDMVPWVLIAFLTPALYACSGIFSDRMRPDGTELDSIMAGGTRHADRGVPGDTPADAGGGRLLPADGQPRPDRLRHARADLHLVRRLYPVFRDPETRRAGVSQPGILCRDPVRAVLGLGHLRRDPFRLDLGLRRLRLHLDAAGEYRTPGTVKTLVPKRTLGPKLEFSQAVFDLSASWADDKAITRQLVV